LRRGRRGRLSESGRYEQSGSESGEKRLHGLTPGFTG
jgi:hypothetical protein